MNTTNELEAKLAEPSDALVNELAGLEGDILLLGVGGKMGPSMAHLAANAIRKAGVSKKVIGVSRFSNENLQRRLNANGVQTISADLLDERGLQQLPDVPNVIYLAGNKFGTTGNEHFTWAMNAYLPGRVCEKYRDSRIVVFSTGNVYPLSKVEWGGSTEATPPAAVGEYGQSCLGRERVFEHFSRKYGIPMFINRLNYAIDMRYGVLLDIARSVCSDTPVDVSMGHVNVIWQGDANEIALRALTRCSTPPAVYNVTGPETVSLRWVAHEFAKRFGNEAVITGEESPAALLSNAAKSFREFGYPRVTLAQMIDWIAEWVQAGGETWKKPTHFQEREGKF